MRANLALGLTQGLFVPQPRPNRHWLAALGTTIEDAEPVLAANAMSASAMWAANAATVSPAAGHGRRPLPPDRRQSEHDAAPQPRMAGDAGAAGAGVRRTRLSRSTRRSRPRSATRARPIICGCAATMASQASKFSSTASPAAPSPRASIWKRRKRSRGSMGSIPAAPSSSSSRRRRSPPAPSTTMSSPSPTSASCSRTNWPSRTRRAHRRAGASRTGLRICRGARGRGAARGRDPRPICSTRSW